MLNKTKNINVRLTQAEHRAIKLASKRDRRTISDYLRVAAIERLDSQEDLRVIIEASEGELD